MTSHTLDATWLYREDVAFYGIYGQRFDVADVVRWSNPDVPTMYDGNHAALPPGGVPVPEQIDRVLDAQRLDGAAPCVDVYGDAGMLDGLLAPWGLRPRPALDLWVVERERCRHAVAAAGDSSLPGRRVAPELWVELCASLEGFVVRSARHEAAMAEAVAVGIAFWGAWVGDRCVAVVARHDHGTIPRVTSLRVDPAFRRTGLARALVQRAVAEAPHEVGFYEVPDGDAAVQRLGLSMGAQRVACSARRRYVAG